MNTSYSSRYAATTTSGLMAFHPDALRGRVYGVTGGSRGIGAAIVAGLLRCGANVLAMALNADELENLCVHHASDADRLQCQCLDVTDEEAVSEAIDRCVERFGRIDGWVNNAMFNPMLSLEDSKEQHFERAWRVNTLATWQSSKLLLPYLRKFDGGAIVNISSIIARQTAANQAAYTSSKAGLEGLTRALAVELAPDHIRVNALAVGYALTYSGFPPQSTWSDVTRLEAVICEELNSHSAPWPQAIMPQDVAGPAVFLLTDAAECITGTTITVDGGLTVDLRGLSDPRRSAATNRIADLRARQSSLTHD